jgi:aspartyl protease family protein
MPGIRIQMIASVAALAACLLAPAGHAADVIVAGLYSGKALLVIDGGRPRMVGVGEITPEGVRLIAADSDAAVIEFGGRRERLTLGHATRLGFPATAKPSSQAILRADSRGHFITTGAVNGVAVRFLVDTGASTVALSAQEARRLGINYRAGTRGYSSTANGTVAVYRVKLDSVRVGEITVHNVDGVVVDGSGLGIALLGMSFLNRMQMKRDGDTLTLTQRF